VKGSLLPLFYTEHPCKPMAQVTPPLAAGPIVAAVRQRAPGVAEAQAVGRLVPIATWNQTQASGVFIYTRLFVIRRAP
jgi:hypothetical protein